MLRDEEKHRKASNFGKRGVRAKARKEKEEKPTLEGEQKGSVEGSQEGGLEGSLKLRGQRPDNPPVSPKLKGGPKPKIRLPDDWEPKDFGEGSQSRAIVESWSPLEFQRQLERFKAHHRKEGSRFSDWQAAWSTWVLNSPAFGGGRGGSGGGNSGDAGGSFVDVVLAEHAQGGRR